MGQSFDCLRGSVGKEVFHKMLGKGTVTQCDLNTGILVVKFRNGTIRFKFPESFRDGTLSFIIQNEQIKQELSSSPYYSRKHYGNTESWGSDEEEDASWANKKTPVSKPKKQNRTVRTKTRDIHNPYDDWDSGLPRKCDTCMDYKRGDCAGLGNALTCKDYSPIPNISKAEKYNWPTQGSASDFKFGKK